MLNIQAKTRIVEVADFSVAPDQHAAFGAALTQAATTVLSQAQGYQAHQILASHETPGRYVLLVDWDSVEAHTVGFRESAAFAEWRAIIGPFFAKPPYVEHFHVVASS